LLVVCVCVLLVVVVVVVVVAAATKYQMAHLLAVLQLQFTLLRFPEDRHNFQHCSM